MKYNPLAPHAKPLFSMIRNRGIVRHFSPYRSADLNKMANSFKTTVINLEKKLLDVYFVGIIRSERRS